ncbi:hypothetical protein DY245_10405 [Streptomyces inhibens]|uniref:Transposase n=1 Tax=Streptomyces inhibens TaxID=2293571 RepID=A0A371Q7M6_STRIH|nr:hypothetical protein DY245_10405 [Streptomyces inhibens]
MTCQVTRAGWRASVGTQWVHLPEKFGNWRGVYNRLRMWAVSGSSEAGQRPPRPADKATAEPRCRTSPESICDTGRNMPRHRKADSSG